MSEKIKAIIVDDEPLARSGLESYAREVDFLEIIAVCDNALEANSALHKHKPQLMFLDIEMPRLSGIEFLKSLPNPPLVIFTTAYPNYALQGFELDVMDYLVKPYPFARFLKAVNKARDLLLLQKQEVTTGDPVAAGYFFVKTENKLERVVHDEINYVQAMENYVIIHTHAQKIMTMMTMKSLEESLPVADFMRVHKSYLVNRHKILSIEGNELRVGDARVPVSRQKKQEIMEMVLGKK